MSLDYFLSLYILMENSWKSLATSSKSSTWHYKIDQQAKPLSIKSISRQVNQRESDQQSAILLINESSCHLSSTQMQSSCMFLSFGLIG